ncbi:MAG TPA: PHB depolymerase family esterase [Rhizomicrobium sp.]|jgi:predicted esterase|nr:PHB depolymerase family esterase [Rhizomicrobium sp.]
MAIADDSRFRRALLGAALACLAAGPALAQNAPTGTLSKATFTAYSPLSGNAEFARRLLSPLDYAQLLAKLPHGVQLGGQPVDLAQESFALYVPPRARANGYGLIVFVPPWDVARLPDGWGPVLDQYGFLFVSASRSGNDQNVLARREPLALLAEANVAARYRLDPARVYIAGFSGGSRVALKLALRYPDVFRGVILNAGSDPIGTAATPLPPRDLFARFQESTHIVYVTGDQDTAAIAEDVSSRHSLRDWCVFQVDERSAMGGGHDAMGGAALSQALDLLAVPVRSDAARLAACRAGIDAQLNAQFAKAQALTANGNRVDALQLVKEIDGRFGGLAAPRSVALSTRLAGSN